VADGETYFATERDTLLINFYFDGVVFRKFSSFSCPILRIVRTSLFWIEWEVKKVMWNSLVRESALILSKEIFLLAKTIIFIHGIRLHSGQSCGRGQTFQKS